MVLVILVGHFMFLNLLYDLVAFFQLHGIVLDELALETKVSGTRKCFKQH